MLDGELRNKSLGSGDTNTTNFKELIDLFYGNWIWRAVHALLDHPKAESSPTWISNTLNISVEETVDALEGLEELGLIEKQGSKLLTKAPAFFAPKDRATMSYTVTKHRQLALQVLNRTTIPQVEGMLDYFLNISPEELYPVLEEIISSIRKAGETAALNKPRTGLYTISLTCSNLAPLLQGERK
jgi:hypothetical protein